MFLQKKYRNKSPVQSNLDQAPYTERLMYLGISNIFGFLRVRQYLHAHKLRLGIRTPGYLVDMFRFI